VTEIEIIEEKIRFGIATERDRLHFENLLRQKSQFEPSTKPYAVDYETRQLNYMRRIIREAKLLKLENPDMNINLGGIPIELYTIL
jgi:hypothetical protein